MAHLLIKKVVSVIEHEVAAYHNEVKNVEEEDVPLLTDLRHITLVQKLRCDSRNIAEEYEAEEGKTLALRGARLPGFHYVKRPGRSEGDDHGDFKYF